VQAAIGQVSAVATRGSVVRRVGMCDATMAPRLRRRRIRLRGVNASTYRRWFLAAVCYNLAWGISVVVYPRWFLWFAAMEPSAAPLAQGIGMMVAVYGYGYYLVAREPDRYRGYIWIALAGKTFGAVGYLVCASAGTLPWRFGVQTLINDLVWFPAFCSYLLSTRHPRIG
jgi:hypothetical protein